MGACKGNSTCCSGRCDNYKAGHNINVSDSCWGSCHSDDKSCRGAAIKTHVGYHKVASNKFKNQTGRNGKIYGTKDMKDYCHGDCHPDKKSCKGGEYTKHDGYNKTGKNWSCSAVGFPCGGKLSKSRYVSVSCPFGKTGGCCKTLWGKKDTGNCNHYVTDTDCCYGHCHPSGTGCRGTEKRAHAGYHKVSSNKFSGQWCRNKHIYGTKSVSDSCYGKCHPDRKSCRGAAIYKTTGYKKVSSGKFTDQYCRDGHIKGKKWVPERMGACSAFSR